jgi:hypothetical protein
MVLAHIKFQSPIFLRRAALEAEKPARARKETVCTLRAKPA